MTELLDQSCAVLAPDTARLYTRLGLHPKSEFPAEIAHAVAATAPPISDVSEHLTALVEAGLLTVTEPDCYRFDGLVHQHARLRAEATESGAQRAETLGRLADWYDEALRLCVGDLRLRGSHTPRHRGAPDAARECSQQAAERSASVRPVDAGRPKAVAGDL